MKTQHYESMEELVFRDKNKLYGAYHLRTHYRRYVTLALLLTLFIFGTIISIPLVAAYMNKGNTSEKPHDGITWDPTPIKPVDPTPLPPAFPEIKVPKTIILVIPKVVDEPVDNQMPTQGDLGDQRPTQAPPPNDNLVPVDKPDNNTPLAQPKTPPEPYTIVQVMPQFPGGEQALIKYISTSVKYPATATDAGIQGKVYIYFVIEPDGSVSNVKVERGIGGGCDEEAMRVIKNMPRWSPGIQQGINVRVSFIVPVNFKLIQ